MCDDHYLILSSPFCGCVNECILGRCSTRCCISSTMPSRAWATSWQCEQAIDSKWRWDRAKQQLSGWEGEDSSESVMVDFCFFLVKTFSGHSPFLLLFSHRFFIFLSFTSSLISLLLSSVISCCFILPFPLPPPPSSPPAPSDGKWTHLSHIEKAQNEMFFKEQKHANLVRVHDAGQPAAGAAA